jgi:hypothetical protein
MAEQPDDQPPRAGPHQPLPIFSERPLPKRFLGHRTNEAFFIIIVLLLLLFVGLIVLHYKVVADLERQQQATLSELASARDGLAHYREAYDSALQDAQAFSKLYDFTYRGETNGTPEAAKTVSVQPSSILNATPKQLPVVNVWEFYSRQGVITDSCILTSKVVKTSQDAVEVVVLVRGKKAAQWPRVTLLIDGAFISSYQTTSEEEQVFKSLVDLPKGTHRLDLLYDNGAQAGGLTIPTVRVGDRTVENTVSIIDYGKGFGMFDCNDTAQGDTLTREGAMRFRIEKV